jgi:hypothetical protein
MSDGRKVLDQQLQVFDRLEIILFEQGRLTGGVPNKIFCRYRISWVGFEELGGWLHKHTNLADLGVSMVKEFYELRRCVSRV